MSVLRCPHCRTTEFDGDWCYNNGAYAVEETSTVKCPKCSETFAFRPYESVGYDVAFTAEELE